MKISMTNAAVARIKSLMNDMNQPLGIRIEIKNSGCSGYTYVMNFAESNNVNDNIFDNNGALLVIDNESLQLIDGTEIDYVKEGLNEGFKFNNPNAKDVCGCGESFNI